MAIHAFAFSLQAIVGWLSEGCSFSGVCGLSGRVSRSLPCHDIHWCCATVGVGGGKSGVEPRGRMEGGRGRGVLPHHTTLALSPPCPPPSSLLPGNQRCVCCSNSGITPAIPSLPCPPWIAEAGRGVVRTPRVKDQWTSLSCRNPSMATHCSACCGPSVVHCDA